jgi:glycosyltransferase involved in cell wall biosynthesis
MHRICIISPSIYPLFRNVEGVHSIGGAETQLRTLGICLSDAGCDVSYVVNDFGQPDYEVINGIKFHKAPLRYMGSSNRYVPADWLRLLRVLEKIDASFYLIKVPRHLLFLLGLYCLVRRRKLVFIGQKDSDVDPAIIELQEGALGKYLYRCGLSLTNALVAQTKYQQQCFSKHFGAESRVIRNVLTLDKPADIEKGDYALWVGNNTADKQPELFVELAKALPERRFVMIMSLSPNGPGDKFIHRRLAEVSNIDYRGFVPFDEIARYYTQARIFVSTSKCEGFPNTFLQSWQCGTPVVSFNIDPDSVIDRYGLGIVAGSFEDLVAGVERLFSDTHMCVELGRNAATYAFSHHSIDVARKQYLLLFDELTS